MFSKVQEQTIEDRQTQSKDSFFIRDTILKQTITQSILNDIDEFLPIQKSSSWFLYHSQYQFKSQYLRPHSESTDTLIRDILQAQFTYTLKYYECISKVSPRFLRVVIIREPFYLRCLNRVDQVHMLLLALKGTDRVSCVFAVQISSISADYAPSELASSDLMLVLNINLNVFLYLWVFFLDFEWHWSERDRLQFFAHYIL